MSDKKSEISRRQEEYHQTDLLRVSLRLLGRKTSPTNSSRPTTFLSTKSVPSPSLDAIRKSSSDLDPNVGQAKGRIKSLIFGKPNDTAHGWPVRPDLLFEMQMDKERAGGSEEVWRAVQKKWVTNGAEQRRKRAPMTPAEREALMYR